VLLRRAQLPVLGSILMSSCHNEPLKNGVANIQYLCVLPFRESFLQVTVKQISEGLSRDWYETFRAGYLSYDCAYEHEHDWTFLLDLQWST